MVQNNELQKHLLMGKAVHHVLVELKWGKKPSFRTMSLRSYFCVTLPNNTDTHMWPKGELQGQIPCCGVQGALGDTSTYCFIQLCIIWICYNQCVFILN